MLRIHFANDTAYLVELLLARLADAPAGPFDAEHLIVPGAGLRRHLELSLASRLGIAANLAFSYPAQWVWQQVTRVVGGASDASPYSAEVLTWRVLHWLERDTTRRHARISAYLEHSDPLMRYELATRVATVLEQLVTYRPDWLSLWAAGKRAGLPGASAPQSADEAWLADAWRHILQATGGPAQHPALTLLDRIAAAGPDGAARLGLPQRVSLFGLAELPPFYLQVMARLGQVIDVDFYVFNPCSEFWFDIVSERQRARLEKDGRRQLHEVGNNLLAHWGQQTRAFAETLIELDEAEVIEAWRRITPDTMLHRLQHAILHLENLAPGSLEPDDTIHVFACHSLTRQLEVLQDQLLALFNADATLQAADVLVVTPALDEAAAAIEAVFGTLAAGDARHIPWRITGRSATSAAPLTRTLFALLAMQDSRFEVSLIYDLLQQDAIARRFGLSDDDLEIIHRWIRESGMRWGRDAAHREQLGVPHSARHTLDHGFRQLFVGLALPLPDGENFAGIVPYDDIEGQRASTLGLFWTFVQRLEALADDLGHERDAAAWAVFFNAVLDDFLAPARDALPELIQLRGAIAEFAQRNAAGGATAMRLPADVARRALEERVAAQAPGGLPGGALTFTGMTPLRQLPYRVVCAVGLEHGVFPGETRHDEFDLMAAFPRKGDRQRRRDDRNVFLDLLLCARDRLLLFHTGRNIRDNSLVPPAVVISDLVDLLVEAAADAHADSATLAALHQRLVSHHPLQAYAPRYFADGALFSFNRELRDAIAAPAQAGAAPFIDVDLPEPEAEWRDLTLRDLIDFVRCPAAFLIEKRLCIDLRRTDERLDDLEPFDIERQDSWAIRDRVLAMFQDGKDEATIRAATLLDNAVPDGIAGTLALQPLIAAARVFFERTQLAHAAEALPAHAFVWSVDDCTLSGELSGLCTAGMLITRMQKEAPVQLLDAWLRHLALCVAGPPAAARLTQWIGTDGEFHLRDDGQAAAHLRDLLGLYRAGLRNALPFFPRAAAKFVETGELGQALRVWHNDSDFGTPESAHPAYQLVWGGDPAAALDEHFSELARRVFVPLFACREKGRHASFV